MIKPITFQEAQSINLPDIEDAVFSINKLIREQWRGTSVEVWEWDLSLENYWFTDCGLGRIKETYELVGWGVKIHQEEDESIRLVFTKGE